VVRIRSVIITSWGENLHKSLVTGFNQVVFLSGSIGDVPANPATSGVSLDKESNWALPGKPTAPNVLASAIKFQIEYGSIETDSLYGETEAVQSSRSLAVAAEDT